MPFDGDENVRIIWAPQAGPQKALIDCPFTEIFWGGSRGGGKTDGILGKWAIKSWRYGSDFNGVFFRKEMPQTDDLIERAKEIYIPLGADWREQPRAFRMPGGGRIRFRPLETVADAEKYQGQNFTDAAVEEAGNYPDPKPIDMLFGALRSKAGVPVQLILTANPGGVGQQWIKYRYVDPSPRGRVPLVRVLPNGAEHRYIYIPSRVQDNRILLDKDPSYINRLYLVGSKELVRAWLEGDWSVVAGAFFPEFSMDKHVVAPRSLPAYWQRFRSFDWGSSRPFAVHWWAVSDGELAEFPRGSLVCYREWYGAQTDERGHTIPNTGLLLTAEEVADGILKREEKDVTGKRVMGGVADPSIFAENGGPSIGDRMALRKVFFRPGDNKRVAHAGAMGGWDQLRARLKGDGEKPAIYFFSTAREIIRTLPALQHDSGNAEDCDSDGEDHAPDSCFVAGTLIQTKRGLVPIESVGLGDRALTRYGYKSVLALFSNGIKEVFNVEFSDGTSLVGTANHPIWVEGHGFIPLNELRYGDIIRPCQKFSLSAARSRNSLDSVTTNATRTIASVGNFYIAQFGNSITEAFRRMLTFTTLTMIQTIISQTICNAWMRLNMSPIMASCGRVSTQPFWKHTRVLRPSYGMGQKPDANGIGSTTTMIARASCTFGANLRADNAASIIRLSSEERADSVQTPASQNGAETITSMIFPGIASGAACHSSSTNIRSNYIALRNALRLANTCVWKKIICATTVGLCFRQKMSDPSGAPTVVGEPTTAGKQKVYNLSIEDVEEYFANGALVHNCRYAAMSRPYTAPLPFDADAPEPDRYARHWKPTRRVKGSAMSA